MSDYLISEETLNSFGDAIRTLSGDNSSMSPAQMINNINSVSNNFNDILKYNQHWWEKTQQIYSITLGGNYKLALSNLSSQYNTTTISYSNEITINSNTGDISLVSPISKDIGYSTFISNGDSELLKGKYILKSNSIYYIEPSSTVNRETYTSDGTKYYRCYAYAKMIWAKNTTNTQYIYSTNRNAHIDYGTESDGYFYKYLGIPFENTYKHLNKVETGYYIGTGAIGPDNANSLTFEFIPKLVIIQNQNDSSFNYNTQSNTGWALFINGITKVWTHVYNGNVGTDELHVNWNENTVSWYKDPHSTYECDRAQLNALANKYYYIALG